MSWMRRILLCVTVLASLSCASTVEKSKTRAVKSMDESASRSKAEESKTEKSADRRGEGFYERYRYIDFRGARIL